LVGADKRECSGRKVEKTPERAACEKSMNSGNGTEKQIDKTGADRADCRLKRGRGRRRRQRGLMRSGWLGREGGKEGEPEPGKKGDAEGRESAMTSANIPRECLIGCPFKLR